MQRHVLARMLLGWTLLAVAWTFANPPFAAPDEIAHYLRAVGIAEGELIGSPAPHANLGGNPADVAFTKSAQRAVTIPARLNPIPYNCYVFNPRLSAACLNRPPLSGPPLRAVTSVGDYPPLGLLAPAAVVESGQNPLTADRAGRLASLALALALLIGAAWALFAPGGGFRSLAGLLAVCTPTAIFLAASLTPSGMSVTAGIALTAALLRIGREQSAPGAVWLLFGVSGTALALSHPTGLAWALVIVAGVAAFEGLGPVRRLLRERRAAVLVGIGIFAAGALASLIWQTLYGPKTSIATSDLPVAIGRVPAEYWNALRDLVAGFGYLEFRLPLIVYLLWFTFVGTIAVAAVRTGALRERRAVMAAGALAVLLPVGVWILFGRAAGVGINGREYMPVMVAFPMLAGEILYRNRDKVAARTWTTLGALAGTAGVIQFVAWYLNGRRSAVGTAGDLLFFSHPGWSPPLGWWPWIVVAACGMLLLATVSIGAAGSPRRRQ